jgi:hypothetical protein
MPVRREGRNVVADGEALHLWLQHSNREPVGVHVVTPDSNLQKTFVLPVPGRLTKRADDLEPTASRRRPAFSLENNGGNRWG